MRWRRWESAACFRSLTSMVFVAGTQSFTRRMQSVGFWILVKILYVRGLAASTTEYDIRVMFESAVEEGCITRVKKIKNFAFVHFKDRMSAEKALNYWNGKELHGSDLEVTWAKPVDKLQKIPSTRRKHAECAKQWSRDQPNLSYFKTTSRSGSVGTTQQSVVLASSAPPGEQVDGGGQVSANHLMSHVNHRSVSNSPLPSRAETVTPFLDATYSQFFNYPPTEGNGATLSVIAGQPSDVVTFSSGALTPNTPSPSPVNFYCSRFAGYDVNNIYMPTYQYF